MAPIVPQVRPGAWTTCRKPSAPRSSPNEEENPLHNVGTARALLGATPRAPSFRTYKRVVLMSVRRLRAHVPYSPLRWAFQPCWRRASQDLAGSLLILILLLRARWPAPRLAATRIPAATARREKGAWEIPNLRASIHEDSECWPDMPACALHLQGTHSR